MRDYEIFRHYMLDRLLEDKVITQSEYDEIISRPVDEKTMDEYDKIKLESCEKGGD